MASRSSETTRNATRRRGPSTPRRRARRRSHCGTASWRARLLVGRRRQAHGTWSDALAPGCARPDNVPGASLRARQSRGAASSAVTISAPASGQARSLGARQNWPGIERRSTSRCPSHGAHHPTAAGASARRRPATPPSRDDDISHSAAAAAGHGFDARATVRILASQASALVRSETGNSASPGVDSLASARRLATLFHASLGGQASARSPKMLRRVRTTFVQSKRRLPGHQAEPTARQTEPNRKTTKP